MFAHLRKLETVCKPLVESLTSSCLVKAYLYRSADTAEVHVDGTHFSELQWGATFTIHHAAEVFSLLSTSHPFPSLSLSLFLAANPASVSYIRVKHTFMGFYTAKYEGRPRWGRVAPRTGMSHVRSGECFVMPAMSEPTLLAKRSIFQGKITIGKWRLCIGHRMPFGVFTNGG